MPQAEFRKFGHQIVDWIADYLAGADRYPVLARVKPGDVRCRMAPTPPRVGESMETILRDFHESILPGVTHWNHPSFFAYFAITGSGPGILGELLSAALNVNAMLWRTSPAATEVEEVVLDWLRQMLGLPAGFEGVILDTASISSLCALAAARESVPGLAVREQGLAGRAEVPRLRLYTSAEAHSSIDKAAVTLGVGLAGIRKIPVDEKFRMDAGALSRALEEDLRAGWLPFCVVATVGTTSTTSVDPVAEIAAVAERHRLWLHVDAAYAGAAAVVPEFRHVLAGCERADSFVVNPHKWLFTPIDCSALFTRRPEVLRQALLVVPEYLRTVEVEGSARNLMDYGISLGRRFRALKLWMVLRYFGQQGIAAAIREHVRLAREFARWVDDDPDFQLMAPVPFSTVCFRAVPRTLLKSARDEEHLDRLNEALLESVNATGAAFLSHTRLRERYVLRLSVGNLRTQERHVRAAWELLREHARRLYEGMRAELS